MHTLIHADTIVSLTGPNNGFNINVLNAVSWTAPSAFSNVSISATISSAALNGSLGSGTVYLTNSLGPGTTVANEIAHTTLTNVADAPTVLNLFSGLTLGPGTYYLSIASDLGGVGLGWGFTNTPVQTLGAGVSTGSDQVSTALAGYSPASNLLTPLSNQFLFTVAGDATPEPGTRALAALFLLAIAVARRRMG